MAVRNLQWVLSSKDKGAAKGFDKVGKAVDGVSGKIKGLSAAGLGAAGLGAGVGAAFAKGLLDSMNFEKANDKLAAQLGAGSPLAESAARVAGKLYVDAYGESIADAGQALRAVLAENLVFEDATEDQMQSVTARLMDVASVFDQEVSGIARAVGQMLKNDLAPDAEAALDLITRGFQQNVNKADDLVDTFNEYGTQFRELGLSGADAMGLMSQGLQAGARDADTVADALKEFAIRAQDGSDASADGFKAIKLNAKEMTKAISRGGPGAKKALDKVLDGLRKIEDPAKRNAAAVALFGTKAEDLQDALFNLDVDKAATGLGTVAGAAERAGTALNDNAATKIESFKRRVQVALVDWIGAEVVPAAEKFADEFQKGVGPGGEFRDTLEDLGDAARDAWPHIKTAFEKTAEIVRFVIKHKDAFVAIGTGVAVYATAMKAAAIWTSVMAGLNLTKVATGMAAINAAGGAGVAGAAAGGKGGGKGGKLKSAAKGAGLAGIIYMGADAIKGYLPGEDITLADVYDGYSGLGDWPKSSAPKTVAPQPRSGDDYRLSGPPKKSYPRSGQTAGFAVNFDGRSMTSAVSGTQQERYARGFLPAF